MPEAPRELYSRLVVLQFVGIKTGDAEKGFVPFYHYRVLNKNDLEVGHINFKVGETDHVLLCAGNIGYGIFKEFRGNSLSLHACLTLAPFVKTIYRSVLITANPDNAASIRIIEKLGGEFIDEIAIPETEPAYAQGERTKNRYRWDLY